MAGLLHLEAKFVPQGPGLEGGGWRDRRGRQAPTLRGTQGQARTHARGGRKGHRGQHGQQQEAASWGPPAGWVSLLPGQGPRPESPGAGMGTVAGRPRGPQLGRGWPLVLGMWNLAGREQLNLLGCEEKRAPGLFGGGGGEYSK